MVRSEDLVELQAVADAGTKPLVVVPSGAGTSLALVGGTQIRIGQASILLNRLDAPPGDTQIRIAGDAGSASPGPAAAAGTRMVQADALWARPLVADKHV